MPFCAYCGSQVADVSYRPCPACGNPANGAPRGAGKSSFPVAVVVIVLAVLAIPIAGILAAIAIPNFLTATQRAKQKRTMADMRMTAMDLERQASTSGSYPRTFAQKADGWGTLVRYECLDEENRPCAGYALTSAGKDLTFEHETAREYTSGATDRFDCDIVYSNGSFLQYPEGVQR